MAAFNYDDLNASFSAEEPVFGTHSTFDTFCQTYLGSMASFAEGFSQQQPQSCSSSSGLGSLLEDSKQGLLEEMEAYTRTDICDWRREDCLDWAGSVCRKRGFDPSAIDMWGFREYSGVELLRFSAQNFSSIVGPLYGPVFHNEFQDLHTKREQAKMLGSGGSVGISSDYNLTSYSSSTSYVAPSYPGDFSGYENDAWDLTSDDIKDLDRYILSDGGFDPIVDGFNEMDLHEDFLPIKMEENYLIPEPVLQETQDAASSGQEHLQKIRPDAKKKSSRGPKNWEFVIRLLADPKTNPLLIRWENQSEGTFRLVQPTMIARLWGQRSNKPNLTYDNFARGLRYHYGTGALQAVSEKQLVYRCGPKAIRYLIDLKNEEHQQQQQQ